MYKIMKNEIVKLSFLIIIIGILILSGLKGDDNILDTDEIADGGDDDIIVIEPKPELKLEPEPKPEPEVELEPELEPELELEPEPIGPNSRLTGLPIHKEAYDLRPIGVMISNIETALPQYGISDADIIYEVMVEGGITRLFALFQDFNTDKIGPIRSSRHYFLDLALEHDAIYTHVGQSVYATAAFKTLDIDRFYGISYLDLILTFQDEDRRPPHSTFTSYDHLIATWDELKYDKESNYDNLKFNFSDEPILLAEGTDLTSIKLDYSGMYRTNPKLVYNDEDGLYYRFQFETEHIDGANNEQLAFKNIIVQYTTTWWIKDDPNGCIDMNLVSSGEGMYITNGKMVPITWSKDDHYAITEYFLENGSKLVLNPGKIMVSIYPKHNVENIIME